MLRNSLRVVSLFLVGTLVGCQYWPDSEKAPGNEASHAKFNSGEHLILGDLAFQNTCQKLSSLTNLAFACGVRLKRQDAQESFSYGELIAFSGDFYRTPEDIYFEKKPSFLSIRRNKIKNVRKTFYTEADVIKSFLDGHSDTKYPDFSVSNQVNFWDYASISIDNISHFGFYNMETYVKYHTLALQLAQEANKIVAHDPSSALLILEKSLFINAFADHFLTDAFASGHIRNPRAQIVKWGKNKKLSEKAAGTLAKIVHDRDGEVRKSGEHGLVVRNSLGEQWFTRCDAQLFWKMTMQDDAIQKPIQAVELSLQELIETFETGEIKPGVFAAASVVPFPAESSLALTDVFSTRFTDEDYKKIISEMAIYLRIKLISGINKKILKQFVIDLPKMMTMFQQDVRSEIAAKPELRERLPAVYLDAYSNIR